MRILVVGDVHWSTYSSIVTSRNQHTSTRLSNLLASLNWVESLADAEQIGAVVYLGDFFDKPTLTSEELTILQEVKWSVNKHYFIVGNHESENIKLTYSSTHALLPYGDVINNVTKIAIKGAELWFVPYIKEENRTRLTDLLGDKETKRLIFSHNDIKGIRYGAFESIDGYEIEDIHNASDLYINGHLHNGSWVDSEKRILNLGNLTGQNFSEDASQYRHHVVIVDTDDMSTSFIDNPYAMNFYKLEVKRASDINNVKRLVGHPVVTAKVEESLVEQFRKEAANTNLVALRVISYKEETLSDEAKEDALNDLIKNDKDHITKFAEFIRLKCGESAIIEAEIQEVIK